MTKKLMNMVTYSFIRNANWSRSANVLVHGIAKESSFLQVQKESSVIFLTAFGCRLPRFSEAEALPNSVNKESTCLPRGKSSRLSYNMTRGPLPEQRHDLRLQNAKYEHFGRLKVPVKSCHLN